MAGELRFADLPADLQQRAAESVLGPQARAAGSVTKLLSEAAVNPVAAATLMRHIGSLERAPTSGTAASIGAQVDVADAAASPPTDPGTATTSPAPAVPAPQETPVRAPGPQLTPEQLAAMVETGEDLSVIPQDQLNAAETALIVSGAATPLLIRRLLEAHRAGNIPASTALQTAAEEIGLVGEYIQRAPPGTVQLESPLNVPSTRVASNVEFVPPPTALPGPAGGTGGGAVPPPGSPTPGGVPPTPEGDPRLRGDAGLTLNEPSLRMLEDAARLRAGRVSRGTPAEMINPRLLRAFR